MMIIASGNGFGQPPVFVMTGQLYSTPRHGFPDRIMGKVFEVKTSCFWVKTEDGKVVADRKINASERGSLQIGQDFLEQFNSSGTISRFESINDNGGVTNYWIVESEGKVISKALNYNMNNAVIRSCDYSYSGGNLTEVRMFNGVQGSLINKIVYDYYPDGNRSKFQILNNKDVVVGYTEFTYNKNGVLEQSKVYSGNGIMISIFENKFNDNGERISSHMQNFANGLVQDYTYTHEYDKNGNWIKIVFYKDNEPYYLRIREIRYYD
jgi:hypothetical protein